MLRPDKTVGRRRLNVLKFRTRFAIHSWVCLQHKSAKEAIMKQSSRDQAEGKLHEVKGKVKEKVGRTTNNPNLEDEGTDEKVAGKVQKKVGQVEKVFEK
jgi:uncharacterized protein YjbJ (UPF0337 family)